MTDRQYLVLLYSFIYFGPQRTKLLMKYFGSARNAWKAPRDKLLVTGLKTTAIGEFVKYRESMDGDKYFKRLAKLGISCTTYKDKDYPANLADLKNAPLVLYVCGKLLSKDINAVSVVGARKMTTYGRSVAHKFSTEIANCGVTIVSGLAMGVDAVAHKAALDVSGRTIAVLGCGLDNIYPANNFGLAKEIVKKGSAIISEYPLGYPALPANFANRNRIISGLSKAVVVVEGKAKSGTILTAKHAADQGREVFAIPGEITSPMSEAPYFLIRNGAKMAISPKDVLDELNLQLVVDRQEVEKIMPSDNLEKSIYKALETEKMSTDEVARKLKKRVSEISSKLVMMELKGVIESFGDGVYGIK